MLIKHIDSRPVYNFSAYSGYVAAMSEKLRLAAEFPNLHPVAIALADITGTAPLRPHRRGGLAIAIALAVKASVEDGVW